MFLLLNHGSLKVGHSHTKKEYSFDPQITRRLHQYSESLIFIGSVCMYVDFELS